MVNQSLTSQTYWLIDHSKPLWPVNEFVPNLDKKYEISPIFQLEIVSKIKILTMSAIMPAQNLKSKCPFGIYVAKWFTNSLGVSDYSVSRNEIFDRSIDQSTSQLSKLTGQPSVKSNAPSPRPSGDEQITQFAQMLDVADQTSSVSPGNISTSLV